MEDSFAFMNPMAKNLNNRNNKLNHWYKKRIVDSNCVFIVLAVNSNAQTVGIITVGGIDERLV